MKTLGIVLVALALAGCGNDFLLTGSGANGGDDAFENGACAKIEGAQIGVENVTLQIGSKSIRFHGWVPKEGEPGEYIGFSIATEGTLVTRVKAGGETYPVDSDSWMNPEYVASGAGSAVSNVESCDPDNDDPNGDPNDDPTGDPSDDPTGDPTDPGTGDPPDFT